MCHWFGDLIHYGSRGQVALMGHAESAKHKKQLKLRQTNYSLGPFASTRVTTTETSVGAPLVPVGEDENISNDISENSGDVNFNYNYADSTINSNAMEVDGNQSNYYDDQEHFDDEGNSETYSSDLDDEYPEYGQLPNNREFKSFEADSYHDTPPFGYDADGGNNFFPGSSEYGYVDHSSSENVSDSINPPSAMLKISESEHRNSRDSCSFKPVQKNVTENNPKNTQDMQMQRHASMLQKSTLNSPCGVSLPRNTSVSIVPLNNKSAEVANKPKISVNMSSIKNSSVTQPNFQNKPISQVITSQDKSIYAKSNVNKTGNELIRSDQTLLTSKLMKRGLELKPINNTAGNSAKVSVLPSNVGKVEAKSNPTPRQNIEPGKISVISHNNMNRDSFKSVPKSINQNMPSKSSANVRGMTSIPKSTLRNNSSSPLPHSFSGNINKPISYPVAANNRLLKPYGSKQIDERLKRVTPSTPVTNSYDSMNFSEEDCKTSNSRIKCLKVKNFSGKKNCSTNIGQSNAPAQSPNSAQLQVSKFVPNSNSTPFSNIKLKQNPIRNNSPTRFNKAKLTNQSSHDVNEYFNTYFDDCDDDEDEDEEHGEEFIHEMRGEKSYGQDCDSGSIDFKHELNNSEGENQNSEMTEEEISRALYSLDDISNCSDEEENGVVRGVQRKIENTSKNKNVSKAVHSTPVVGSTGIKSHVNVQSNVNYPAVNQKLTVIPQAISKTNSSCKQNQIVENRVRSKPLESLKHQNLPSKQCSVPLEQKKVIKKLSPEFLDDRKCDVSRLENISDHQKSILKSMTERQVVTVTNLSTDRFSNVRNLNKKNPVVNNQIEKNESMSDVHSYKTDNVITSENSESENSINDDDYDSEEYDMMMEELLQENKDIAPRENRTSEHIISKPQNHDEKIVQPILPMNSSTIANQTLSQNKMASRDDSSKIVPIDEIIPNNVKIDNVIVVKNQNNNQDEMNSRLPLKDAKNSSNSQENAFNTHNQSKNNSNVKRAIIEDVNQLEKVTTSSSVDLLNKALDKSAAVLNTKYLKPAVIFKKSPFPPKIEVKINSNLEVKNTKNVTGSIAKMCKLLSNNKNLTISIVQPATNAGQGGLPNKNNFSIQKNRMIKKCVKCGFCGKLTSDFDVCDNCGKNLPKISLSSGGKNLVHLTSNTLSSKQFYGAKLKDHMKQHVSSSSASGNANFSENTPGRKVSETKKGKAKNQEPVCLTLSSDEEGDGDKSDSNRPSSTNLDMPVPEDRNETQSDDDDASGHSPATKAKSECSSGRNSPRLDPVQFYCRSIRIGSFRIVHKHLVTISNHCISFQFSTCHDSEDILVSIPKQDINQILGHFGTNLQVLYIVGTETCGKYLRTQLKMSSLDGPYYDPAIEDETQKWICLIPEKCHSSAIQEAINIYFHDIFDIIDKHLANNILIRSTPIGITDLQKPNVTSTQNASNSGGYETRSSTIVSTADISLKPKQPVFHMATYPPHPSTGRIAITTEDYECLHPGEFLNDVIIDFYLKYLFSEKLSEEDKMHTHIFSSFFYGRLTTRPQVKNAIEDDASLKPQQKRHSRVKTWTRHTDIFSKDFIIIPINEKSHWFLAIICFPGHVESSKRSLSQDDESATEECPSKQRKLIQDESSNDKPEAPSEAPSEALSETPPEEPKENGSDTEETMDHRSSSPNYSKLSSSLENDNKPPSDSENNCNEESSSSIPPDETSQDESSNDKTRLARKQSCLDPNFSNRVPCILIFDSLNMPRGHTVIFNILREYLTEEWAAKKQSTKVFNKDNMKGTNLKVPQQDNYSDCGVFVLQYVESFFETPIMNFVPPLWGLENWFTEELVKTKRQEIQGLIKRLAAEQGTKYELREYVSPPSQPPQDAEANSSTEENVVHSTTSNNENELISSNQTSQEESLEKSSCTNEDGGGNG
ncbi:Sentrin-specific protease 6 [Nymphon striatum]|nr:Sentrin-specific protease 6 [Nymphon striatum]